MQSGSLTNDVLDFMRLESNPLDERAIIQEIQMLARTNPGMWPDAKYEQWALAIDQLLLAGKLVRVGKKVGRKLEEPKEPVATQRGLFD